MSLVRGVTYCAHPIEQRELIPSDKFTKKVDQGENNYSFRLTVAPRDLLERKTAEFVGKPFALNIFPIPAAVKDKKPFDVMIGDGVVSLSALKKMDGAQAVVMRLLNNTPNAVSTYVEVNSSRLPLEFGKYEVKTVIFDGQSLTESYELLI